MRLWHTVGYHKPQELSDGVTLELLDAGHILGSAMLKLSREERSLVFTGDLGGGNSPLLSAAESPGPMQYLVMESVYGDVVREDEDRRARLERVIEDTAARGGTLLIPAFSTERTQDLLFEIRMLMKERRIPPLPVYLDSPLAEKITRAYLACPEYFSPEMRKRIEGGEDIFTFPELRFVENVDSSRAIIKEKGSKIILAGSGMGSGGRVRAHYAEILPDERSTLLVVGYQAAGTPGRRLVEGVKKLDLRDKTIPVKAKVETIYGYSAHMDGERLLEFANKVADASGGALKEIFVVEGEPASTNFLTQRIRDYLGVRAIAPDAGDSATINF